MTDQQGDLGALFTRVLASPRGSEMAFRLQQSLEMTDALWDLVPIVMAASEKYQQRTPAEVSGSSAVAAFVSAKRRQALHRLGDRFRQMTNTALATQTLDESVLEGLSSADLLAGPFGIINQAMDTPGFVQQVLQTLATDLEGQLLGLSAAEATYLAAYLQAVDPQPKTPALLRALFAAAVGTVEPLVTRMVLVLLYEASPETYNSMADPRLEKKARKLCRGAPGKGSPEAWREALVDTLGVSSLADAVDWDGLARLWEARNVVAHRGGIADARYSEGSPAEIGSLVASESETVKAAIDEVGAIRFAIVAGVWDSLAPGIGAEIGESTCIPLWTSPRAGRWRQAAGLARVEELFASDAGATATAKVNGWLALDQGHGPEAIAASVEAWDVSALPPLYAADLLARCGVGFRRAMLIGGGARSMAIRKLAPGIFGRDVDVPEPAEYVALGAARQAAWALAGTPDPPDWPRPSAVHFTGEPQPEVRSRYALLRDATTGWDDL